MDDTKDTPSGFADWVIIELMGHRRFGAYATEATIAGALFLRIDVPSDPPVTQYYNAKTAVFSITPTTEAIARDLAATNRPTPVHRFELGAAAPAPSARAPREFGEDMEDHDDDSDDFPRIPIDQCPRCSECVGQAHHWIENSEFDDEGDPEFECKHCEAVCNSRDDDQGFMVPDESTTRRRQQDSVVS